MREELYYYYMLFRPTRGAALDTPHGINVRGPNGARVNALAVFSSAETAEEGKGLAGADFYMEGVRPDDVVALAARFGVSYVMVDPVDSRVARGFEAQEAAEILSREHVTGKKKSS